MKEKCDFHFPWMSLITFSERNDLAEVKNKTKKNNWYFQWKNRIFELKMYPADGVLGQKSRQ